jgi:hypothetical protein
MFELEKAISEWRREMLSGGIKTPVTLDELENHLRDDVQQAIKRGLTIQQAFDAAVLDVGTVNRLAAEFKKIQATPRRSQILGIALILAALFGTVFGGAMVMPALGRWRDTGTLVLWPVVVGACLTTVSGWVAFHSIRRRKVARGGNSIIMAIVAAGSFYCVPLIQAFFVRRADLAGWVFCAILATGSICFYGTCLRFCRNPSSASVR